MNLKITLQFYCLLFITTITAQSITVDAGNIKQKIEFIGADYERSQNFVQKATNSEEIIDWAFKDIDFNIARVAYDKIQKTENYKFEIEANNITATGTYVQWQLLDAGNGFFYIQNVASNTYLQTTNEITNDKTGNRVFSKPARSCTGSWCKWEMIESTANPGFYNIRNVGLNKYLQCTSDSSVNSGLFIKAVGVNTTNAKDEASLWSISQQGTSKTKIFIDNKGFQKRLRYTDIDEVVENMAFYNDAIATMKTIKLANPDVKLLATMRSDYNGYNSDNRNNLPEYIYNYSCVEADENGKCIRTLGNKSLNTEAFGIFLADYLELMHNNGVTISYLATAKEWTGVVTAQRSHDTYLKLVSECAIRNIPLPKIIGPASWSLSQGVSYTNNVASLGFENEYHSFSSHNLNNQDNLYDDFFNAANNLGKKAWNDESSAGGGSRTSGVNPDISLAINAYKEKIELYNGGLVGECFFEINSRGVNSETRAIYFKNNTAGKRLRSYYIMKNFANGALYKNYVNTSVFSLTDVYTMAFVLDGEFTLVIVNNNENDIEEVPVTFSDFQIDGDVKALTWTNNTIDEGDESKIVLENSNLFKVNIKAQSINIFTKEKTPLSTKDIFKDQTISVYPIPISGDIIHVKIDNSYLQNKITYSVVDYTRTNVESNSTRQGFQMSLGAGGANGLLGGDHLFDVGDILLDDRDNLLYMSPSNNDNTRTTISNKAQFFDNYTTNNILGLRTTYTPSEKFNILFDVSYSDLDFFQNLTQATGRFSGRRGETADGYDQTDLSIDVSGKTPNYGLPADVFNPQNMDLNNVSRRLINTKGYNYASKIDVEYYLSNAVKLTSGARYAITDFEARETLSSRTSNFDAYGPITDEQEAEFQSLLTHTAGAGFNGGTVGGLENGWIYIPGYKVLDMFPGFTDLDGGSVFDFDVDLENVVSEEGNLIFNPAKSYGAEETSTDFYTQLDWQTALFQIPVALNFGVRAIRTGNTSEGFSTVEYKDYQDDDDDDAKIEPTTGIYHEVSNSRWDVLPSFNSNFTLQKRLKLRLNVSRGVSRPKFRDLIPNNTVTFVTNIPDGTDLSAQTLVRGEVKSGNPDLKPYTAWMYDLTLEGYTKSRGAFIFSAFYKDIKDYISRGVIEDTAYPGEELLGIPLPDDQQGLLFDVSQPINIADGQIYGFEAGVTQPFTFLPGFAKGFGIKANYSYIESSFEGAVGDAANGFPGTSKHSANGTFYYEQKAFSLRFTAAYRGDYLSNLGGVGSTRADESHYTEGTTILGLTAKVNMLKRKLQLTAGVSNMTGEDIRRYQGDDKASFSAYYDRDPIWKFGLRYKF